MTGQRGIIAVVRQSTETLWELRRVADRKLPHPALGISQDEVQSDLENQAGQYRITQKTIIRYIRAGLHNLVEVILRTRSKIP